MPQEMMFQHDGCYYKCYLKRANKRIYCRKEDSRCTPRPLDTTTFIASLYPELQGAFKLINRLVESGQREAKLITIFVNYVKPQNYVYSSPRPIPLGMPHIAQIIPIGMGSDEFQGIDLVVTTKKLSPKEMYDYELTPMTPAAEYFFKITNLIRYKILTEDELVEMKNLMATYQVNTKQVHQQMYSDAEEYYAKRYKTNGRYAATKKVAYDLTHQLSKFERKR